MISRNRDKKLAIRRLFGIVLLFNLAAGTVPAADESREPVPNIADITRDLAHHQGLLTFHLDSGRGRLWLEVPPAPEPADGLQFLYVEGLTIGLGSNPIGLDRGQIGPARLVALRRVGGRLLVEEINLKYRARSDDTAERAAVRESFARSVLWGGPIAAEDPDGRILVDFTSFLVRDAHGSAATLRSTGQGEFEIDPDRSALDPEACLSFPDNLEFESILTFASDEPGALVVDTLPYANAITLRQHHSLLRLPDDGYRPRLFDPRAGSYDINFHDYAAPLDAPLVTRYIVRHRLEKIDAKAPSSRVKAPIVYYLDRGVPEPVRSALLDGARWWADAFEAAGFIDAFRVEMLPEGAHPLDARYNVIQWVHRSTRGWSYGGGVIDPRTGEMIKGHVNLGSLRVRQDRLLFEGLAGTARTGSGSPDDPVELALARIRQLSAHEVGHTLGFSHNFAASTYGRASVMDYPAPLIRITSDGQLDFSDAYAAGVGAWDRHAVRYAYSDFPPGAGERESLDTIIREGFDQGLLFLSDADARPAGAAHPLANLWDNGDDPVEALRLSLRVRRIALDRFGETVIKEGTPLALMQEVLVPVYLHHRFQLEAAAKVIGGLEYTYAVRGDGQPPARFIDPTRQRRALEVILSILKPEGLDLPEEVLQRLLPRPFGYEPHRELFDGRTDPVFDPLGAAATAADMVLDALLQPERAARLVDFHRREPRQPGLSMVLDSLIRNVFEAKEAGSPRHAALVQVVQARVVDRLIRIASGNSTTHAVRAEIEASLPTIDALLREAPGRSTADRAHRSLLRAEIARHLARQRDDDGSNAPAPEAPPGSPIGTPSTAPG